MALVQPLNGQSNYDLCLQVYGSLDMLIKFCRDNNISDINQPIFSSYFYDPNLVVDKSVTGYKYKTYAR